MAERARARKSKGKKGGNGIGHNSAAAQRPMLGNKPKEEIYRRWLSKIETADAIYQRAKDAAKSRLGEMRAIFAAAKEDGVNIDAVKKARKEHRQDHLTVAQDYDDMGFVLRMMKSPLAEQLNLFAPPERSPEATAGLQGELAGRRGDSMNDCPHPPGTDLYVTYRAAWDRGQQALAETMRD